MLRKAYFSFFCNEKGSYISKYNILTPFHKVKHRRNQIYYENLFYHIQTSVNFGKQKCLHWHGLELSKHRIEIFWLKIMYLTTGNNCNNIPQIQHHLIVNIFFNQQIYYVI
jgi:hypothetical protein